jgi:hypothetical protein
MANTGIKTVLTLRKYVDGVATSEVKINDPADPDYIAPYEDLVDCPVSGGVTPTTVAPTTATPTTQAQTTQAQTTQAQTTQAQTTQAQLFNTFQLIINSSNPPYGWGTKGDACTGSNSQTVNVYVQHIYSTWQDVYDGTGSVYTSSSLSDASKLASPLGSDWYTDTSGNAIRLDQVDGAVIQYEPCVVATTQAPTTQAPSGDCNTYLLENTSGIGTVGFSFTGCGPDLGRNATTVTADGRETVCSSTVPTSSSPNAAVEDLGACGSVSTTIQPTTAAPAALQQFFTTNNPENDSTGACQLLVSATRWHNGSGFIPAFGDTVYLNNSTSGGTLGQGFWGTDQGVYYRTDSSGIVIETGPCGGGGFN